MIARITARVARAPRWVFPPLIGILAFGIFIPKLGFYWDDWPILFYIDTQNLSGLITYYSFDRPFAAYLGIAASFFAGTYTILWQVLVLGLRLGATFAVWGVLKNLGPRYTFLAASSTLLFLIYPGYDTQPMNSTYAHWATYLFFFLSLYGTGKALRNGKHAYWWTALALVTQAVNIFSLEFFVVLEFIRPVYIALILREKSRDQLLIRTMKLWLPFVGLLSIWFVWRFFFLVLPGEPHPLQILVDLRSGPVQALFHYGFVAASDVFYLCVAVWAETLFRLSTLINFWWLLIAVLSALLALAYIAPFFKSQASTTREALCGMALGAICVFFGLAPVWIIGDAANSGGYGSHYLLGGLFGASVFMASVVTLLPTRYAKLLAISILSLLAIGRQLSVSNEFANVWEDQRTFYWQLYWRAPELKPSTALVFFYPISAYMQQSSTSMAINTLYPQTLGASRLNHWTYDIRLTQVQRSLERRLPLQTEYRKLLFVADDESSQLFVYKADDSCLWVLSPIHILNDYIPSEARYLLEYTDMERISPTRSFTPAQQIFGEEPEHSWCYYFEKADLSAQQNDWTAVISKMEEAESKGLRASYALEYVPLLRAFAFSNQWGDFITRAALLNEGYKQSEELMCALWDELDLAIANSTAKESAIASVREIYACTN